MNVLEAGKIDGDKKGQKKGPSLIRDFSRLDSIARVMQNKACYFQREWYFMNKKILFLNIVISQTPKSLFMLLHWEWARDHLSAKHESILKSLCVLSRWKCARDPLGGKSKLIIINFCFSNSPKFAQNPNSSSPNPSKFSIPTKNP